MTVFQQIIKFFATLLAICIIVSVFAGIFTAIGVTGEIFRLGGKDKSTKNNTEIAENMKDCKITTIPEKLKIDLESANLEIVCGDKFSLKSNLKNMMVSEENGVLKIKDKNPILTVRTNNNNIILTIPEDCKLKSADISAGAGQIKADKLCADKIELELGAGTADIKNICAYDKARIEGGAGRINITDGNLCNAKIELGTGKFDYTGEFSGDSKIDFGVGNSVLNLKGCEDDYKIKLDHGIGDTKIADKDVDGDGVYGDGDRYLDIDGGIGSITINFSEE